MAAEWAVLLVAAWAVTRENRVRWPVRWNVVTSPFGPRVHPVTGKSAMHHGIDVRADVGTIVRAPWNGVAVFSESAHGGLTVNVSRGPGSGDGFVFSCMHLSSALVDAPCRVVAGQPIAKTGASGRVTGPHAHIEVRGPDGRPRDPSSFFSGFYPDVVLNS